MQNIDPSKSSNYMHWAKTQMRARFNLGSSGVMFYPFKDLGVSLEEIEMNGSSYYGYEPLQKALAEKCAVPSDCVAAATGTSMANHLVMAALLNPGDEVLIELPTYDLLLSVARYLKTRIKRFTRKFEKTFEIDPQEIRELATSKTRLIVVTNLHNPSGVLTSAQTLKEIGSIAKRMNAKVLVDEVYLECLYLESGTPASAFHLGTEFISTNSLTKAFGLNGLRCGWVLAEPEIIQKVWRLNDLFGVIPAHTAELLSVTALQKIAEIGERAKRLLQTNREILNQFFDRHQNELEVIRPQFGTISFPRLKNRNVDEFCTSLKNQFDTCVVPGRFFEMPNHFRIGFGCSTEILQEGLQNISAVLTAKSQND